MSDKLSVARYLKQLGVLAEIPDDEDLESIKAGPILTLSKLGVVDEKVAINAIAKALNITYLDLTNPKTVGTLMIDLFEDVIDPPMCVKHKMIPVLKDKDSVIIAFANPLDIEAKSAMSFIFSSKITPAIAEESKILNLLADQFPTIPVQATTESESEDEDIQVLEISNADDQVADLEDTSPVIKLVNQILRDGIASNASDLHLEPSATGLQIRFRIDGVMQSIFKIPKRLQAYVNSRFKLLAKMDLAEKRRPQDGRIRVRVERKCVDMRLSSIPTPYGEKIVIRLLRTEHGEVGFHTLGIPEVIEKKLIRALDSSGKLLLVTGPTGSGKTTTLYTALRRLMDGTNNITTVEDPIEYQLAGVNQIQVNAEIDMTFASALRSILRQDPDAIMIGEIRDPETMEIALSAAQTGHLVLSTLHTNDAHSAVTRILNLGADPFVLGSSLVGILAQRLARKNCVNCIEPYPLEELKKYEELMVKYKLDAKTLKRGRGCETCYKTGYQGRLGIYSYLEISEPIEELIGKKAPSDEIARVAKKYGYADLDDAAADLLRAGLTSFDEVKGYLKYDAQDNSPAGMAMRAAAHATPAAQIAQPSLPPNMVPAQGNPTLPPPQYQSQSAAQPPPPPRPLGGTYQPIDKTRILIIEDSVPARKLMGAMLRKALFEVFEAENGQDGLQKIALCNPQAVLCDLKMPVMDGKEFLKQIKANAQTATIPVIMLTGDDTPENQSELIAMGAKDFLSKRGNPSELVNRILSVTKTS